jgi:hypothetical protein
MHINKTTHATFMLAIVFLKTKFAFANCFGFGGFFLLGLFVW